MVKLWRVQEEWMCLVLRGTVSANKKKNLENARLVLSLNKEIIKKLQTNIKRKEVLICYSVIHNFEVIGPRMDCVLLWHVCISAQHTQSYLTSLSSPFDHSPCCKIPLKKKLKWHKAHPVQSCICGTWVWPTEAPPTTHRTQSIYCQSPTARRHSTPNISIVRSKRQFYTVWVCIFQG